MFSSFTYESKCFSNREPDLGFQPQLENCRAVICLLVFCRVTLEAWIFEGVSFHQFREPALLFRPLKMGRNFLFGCVLGFLFPTQNQVPQIMVGLG